MMKKCVSLIAVMLLIGICAISLNERVYAQEETGLSIASFPDNTGKADEIESLISDKFGDNFIQWTEEAVVTYPEGDKVELYHYFEYPTDDEIGEQIVEIITGRPYAPPGEQSNATPVNRVASSTWNCMELRDHWYYLGDYFLTCGTQFTSKAENTFGSMNERAASYSESLTSGAVDLYDNTSLSGYLGTLIDDTGVMPTSMRDKSSSGYFYY